MLDRTVLSETLQCSLLLICLHHWGMCITSNRDTLLFLSLPLEVANIEGGLKNQIRYEKRFPMFFLNRRPKY